MKLRRAKRGGVTGMPALVRLNGVHTDTKLDTFSWLPDSP
jgi:hypothetical protein